MGTPLNTCGLRLAALTLVGGCALSAASGAPLISAEHGMVVTAQRLASQVGVDVLKRGGNAIDAAVAVAYALAVVYPAAGNLGGGGFMTVRTAKGKSVFIDFREKAPLAAAKDMFLDPKGAVIPNASTIGHLAVAVPGTVAGMELALSKYGSLPRSELLAPAVSLAEQGFELTSSDAEMFTRFGDALRLDPASAAVFFGRGRPLMAGDVLVQKDLAGTLRTISAQGVAGFYKGKVADAIVASSRNGSGVLTLKDLADYSPRELKPTECNYRGYVVISAPPPSAGGTAICEMLNILQGYPMQSLGFRSAKSVHYQIEVMRLAFADRRYLGDPDFVRNPVDRLLDRHYADDLRAKIDDHRASVLLAPPSGSVTREGHNTTHYSIADSFGNAVSVTYTLNGWFGAKVMAANTGVLLNDEMDDFTIKLNSANAFGLIQGQANEISPGKRPLSSMSPTIVTKDGKPVMILGTPGGSRIITAVLEMIVNVIDYQMNIQDAVDVPQFHHQWAPDVTGMEAAAFTPEARASLTRDGHRFNAAAGSTRLCAILIGAPAFGAAKVGSSHFYGAIQSRDPGGAALGY